MLGLDMAGTEMIAIDAQIDQCLDGSMLQFSAKECQQMNAGQLVDTALFEQPTGGWSVTFDTWDTMDRHTGSNFSFELE